MYSPACLSKCRFFKRKKRSNNSLTKYFNESESKLITELLKRYMNEGFILWSLKLTFENLKICLNNMTPSIKFTFEKPEIIYENGSSIYEKAVGLKLLDVKKILQEDNSIEIDIYYKLTNIHY